MWLNTRCASRTDKPTKLEGLRVRKVIEAKKAVRVAKKEADEMSF